MSDIRSIPEKPPSSPEETAREAAGLADLLEEGDPRLALEATENGLDLGNAADEPEVSGVVLNKRFERFFVQRVSPGYDDDVSIVPV